MKKQNMVIIGKKLSRLIMFLPFDMVNAGDH